MSSCVTPLSLTTWVLMLNTYMGKLVLMRFYLDRVSHFSSFLTLKQITNLHFEIV